MKIYKYDSNTKEYLGYMDAYLDPLETIKQKRDVYVIPPNFTVEKPEQPPKGYTTIFNGTDWESIEDHRNLIVYNKKSGYAIRIDELGPIPEGYVLEKPVLLDELRTIAIKEVNVKADKARKEDHIIQGIKCSVELLPELMEKLNNFGPFNTINIVQGDEDVQVTKEELEEAIKYFYILSMLIPKRKKELFKEINSCRSKSKLQEFTPDFDIDKEVAKLMKLSTEELNEEFAK